jgi:hypothetical protein
MNEPFWYFRTDRTVFSDDTYGMIGRALTFATRFESNCRALSILLGLKSKVMKGEFSLSDQEHVAVFVKGLHKKILYEHMKSIKEHLNLDEDVYKLIYNAKDARNYLVHELTLGIEYNIETDQGRENVVNNLKETIIKIARADIFIICLMAAITNEELPCISVGSYINMVLKWVLEVEEE